MWNLFRKNIKKEFDESYIYSPIAGKILNLEEVNDPVFSQKMLGDGFAVRPNEGIVNAPVSGTISAVFPTKHAIGLRRDDGLEVLIHVGVDTVGLNGEGFQNFVKEGDKVSIQQKLIVFDKKYIEENAPSSDVMVIFTNSDEFNFKLPDVRECINGEKLFQVVKA